MRKGSNNEKRKPFVKREMIMLLNSQYRNENFQGNRNPLDFYRINIILYQGKCWAIHYGRIQIFNKLLLQEFKKMRAEGGGGMGRKIPETRNINNNAGRK